MGLESRAIVCNGSRVRQTYMVVRALFDRKARQGGGRGCREFARELFQRL